MTPIGTVSLPDPHLDSSNLEAFRVDVVAHAIGEGWNPHRAGLPGVFPTLLLVRGDRGLVAELLPDDTHPTPTVERWIDKLTAVPGVDVHMWRPSDWSTITQILERHVFDFSGVDRHGTTRTGVFADLSVHTFAAAKRACGWSDLTVWRRNDDVSWSWPDLPDSSAPPSVNYPPTHPRQGETNADHHP